MIKDNFPYFKNSNNVYLDNASTSQKPQSVIDSVVEYYSSYCSNTHRGSYKDGNRATTEFESSRDYLKNFIGASSNKEILFTKGITEGINMVASSYVKNNFKTVIISSLEHHSNIVPWHMLGNSINLEVVAFKSNLEFDLQDLESKLIENPKAFVSVSHVSNAFGVVQPIKAISKLTHKYGGKILVDGAQSLSRFKIDVKELDIDFYTISSHKSYGPTGVGALYVKEELLKDFLPYQTGGAVIDRVTYKNTTFLDSPHCYEAGTQNIAGVIGFKSALKYISEIGYSSIEKKESELTSLLYKGLKELKGIELYTENKGVVGNISFNIKGVTPIDIGLLLDKQNVSVRAGHHCAMPIMDKLGINGTVRVSLGIYNTEEDINKFFLALNKALKIIRD